MSPPFATRIPGLGLRFTGSALLLVLLSAAQVSGQFVESPLVPRGAILLEAGSVNSQAARLFDGSGGTMSFAPQLFGAPLTTVSFPGLAPEEDRLRSLVDDPGRTLSMGVLRGRYEVDEQRTPLRVGWGVLDRVTVGATLPLVRRQDAAAVRLDPDGANVGRNPAQGPDASRVSGFRSEAGAALAEMTAQVEDVCTQEGEESAQCTEGRAAVASVSGFLDLVGEAWDEALLFPLTGSDAGQALANRWAAVRSHLEAWNAESPETIPLSMRPLAPNTFESEFVAPVWGTSGFPTSDPSPLVEIGDVELHLALGILDGGERGDAVSLRVRSAVEISARLPTGPVDSMALLAPMEPVRGYGGAGIRWISDILLADRGGILAEVEWWSFQDRETLLLGADPEAPWNPDTARQIMTGAPGDLLRLRITPRFIVVPGLSLGAGWESWRSGDGSWRPVLADSPPGGGAGAVTLPGTSRQRVTTEIRVAGWDSDRFPSLPFPVELLGRASLALSGSEGTPRDRRFEIQARVLRGAR